VRAHIKDILYLNYILWYAGPAAARTSDSISHDNEISVLIYEEADPMLGNLFRKLWQSYSYGPFSRTNVVSFEAQDLRADEFRQEVFSRNYFYSVKYRCSQVSCLKYGFLLLGEKRPFAGIASISECLLNCPFLGARLSIGTLSTCVEPGKYSLNCVSRLIESFRIINRQSETRIDFQLSG